MTKIVSNKVDEVENRFNALTSKQQQDAEVIDARVDFKGVAFNSLKERIDNTDKILRDSTISIVTSENNFTTVAGTSTGYFDDVKLEGKTLIVNSDNEIVEAGTEGAILKSVGDGVDEVSVESVNGNLFDNIDSTLASGYWGTTGNFPPAEDTRYRRTSTTLNKGTYIVKVGNNEVLNRCLYDGKFTSYK